MSKFVRNSLDDAARLVLANPLPLYPPMRYVWPALGCQAPGQSRRRGLVGARLGEVEGADTPGDVGAVRFEDLQRRVLVLLVQDRRLILYYTILYYNIK